MYKVLYLSIFLVLFVPGYYFLKNNFLENKNLRVLKFKRKRFLRKLKTKWDDGKYIIDGVVFKLSLRTYSIFRAAFFGVWFLSIAFSILKYHIFPKNQIIFWFLLIAFTSPKEKFLFYPTFFSLSIKFLKRELLRQKDNEIYRSVCQLKNLAIAKKDESISSDFILEELMKFSQINKKAYARVLFLWYEYSYKEACDAFAKTVGTKKAREFSKLFIMLDNLKPKEFLEQLDLFIETFKSEKETAKDKLNKRKGNILFACAAISALIIMLNFVVVGALMETLSRFQEINNMLR